MSTKTKKTMHLAVVSENLFQMPLLHALEALAMRWRISACMLDTADSVRSYPSSLSFRLFAPIKDMPGYMRGMEDELGDADLIVADEAWRLSSFQALRAGLKHSIPVAIHSSETDFTRFRDFANVMAIQADVLANAKLFLTSHEDARQALLAEGVDAARIVNIGVGVTIPHEERSATLRKRFRDYLKVGQHDVFVGLAYDDANMDKAAESIQALRMVRTQNPSLAQRLLVLFMGGADLSVELKYRVYDQGLSRQVKFLHQDIEPFRQDLYAALDAVILSRAHLSSLATMRPWLEAFADGVIPLMPEGAMLSQQMQACAVPYRDDSFSGLAQTLQRLLANRPKLPSWSETTRQFMKSQFNAQTQARTLEDLLLSLHQEQNRGSSAQTFREMLERAEECLRMGRWHDVQVLIEDLKLRTQPNQAQELGRLHWLRGQLAFQQQIYDEAVAAFSDSVAYDGQCWPSYLGLAQVSLLSHAHEEARRFFRKVLALSPENAQAMLGLGMVCRRVEEFDEALLWFRECLKKEPQNARALTAFMQTAMELASEDESVILLESVRDIVGDIPNLVRALGQLYIRQGNVALGNSLLAGLSDDVVDGHKSA